MLEVAEGCKDRNVVLCSLESTSRLRDRTLADASGRKPTNPRPQSPGLLCRRGECNPKPTPSKRLVSHLGSLTGGYGSCRSHL